MTVEDTLERNQRVLDSAKDEARKLHDERTRSDKVLGRARKSLRRLTNRHSTTA